MRRTTSSLPLLLLAISLVGCGGLVGSSKQGAPTAANPAPGDPSTAGDPAKEAPVLFAAARGSALFVVAARADTGEVTAFGPALPQSADSYAINTIQVSVDGKSVVVAVTPKVGTPNWTSNEAVILLGNGSSAWQTLDHGADVLLENAAADLSLIVTRHECPVTSGTADASVSVIRAADGTHLYDDAPCTAGQPASFVASIAQDGSYIVVRTNDGALSLHGVDGRVVPLTTPTQEAIVGQCFATSLLVGDVADAPRARWVDAAAGKAIDVPGWSTAVSTSSGLQLLDGALYALEDRGLKRVLALPAGVDPETITGVRGDLVLTRKGADNSASPQQMSAVDPTGAVVASYAPTSASAAPHDSNTPSIIMSTRTSSTTDHDAWSVVEDDYETTTPSQNGANIYERADDLWLFVDRAGSVTSKTVPLRRSAIPTAQQGGGGDAVWPEREYVASSTGAYVLFSETGALHTIDVDSGVNRLLTTDFIIAKAVRHTAP